MKMNMNALKALELKLAEYDKTNEAIAEHESANNNMMFPPHCSCSGDGCYMSCDGSCKRSCSGSCYVTR